MKDLPQGARLRKTEDGNIVWIPSRRGGYSKVVTALENRDDLKRINKTEWAVRSGEPSASISQPRQDNLVGRHEPSCEEALADLQDK